MTWLEIFSPVLAVIAVVMSAGSLWISRKAHKLSEMQALPRIIFVRSWSSQGERGLYIKLETMSDGQDWVMASLGVRRNWRKRSFLARGEVAGHDVFDDGIVYPRFKRIGDWERSVTYELWRTEVAVFLHPDAPDCDVAMEITLSTSPSPVVKRDIKSPRETPSQRVQRGVIES